MFFIISKDKFGTIILFVNRTAFEAFLDETRTLLTRIDANEVFNSLDLNDMLIVYLKLEDIIGVFNEMLFEGWVMNAC